MLVPLEKSLDFFPSKGRKGNHNNFGRQGMEAVWPHAEQQPFPKSPSTTTRDQKNNVAHNVTPVWQTKITFSPPFHHTPSNLPLPPRDLLWSFAGFGLGYSQTFCKWTWRRRSRNVSTCHKIGWDVIICKSCQINGKGLQFRVKAQWNIVWWLLWSDDS